MLQHPDMLVQIRPHKRRPKRLVDDAYRAWVAQLPCCLCGRGPTEEYPNDPHHLMRGVVRGTGMKAGDDKVVPLCHAEHDELHRAGDEEWYLLDRGVKSPLSLAAEIRAAYLLKDRDMAVAALLNARKR